MTRSDQSATECAEFNPAEQNAVRTTSEKAKSTATDLAGGAAAALSLGSLQHECLMGERNDLGLHCCLSSKPKKGT
jgi:hypothetical protein